MTAEAPDFPASWTIWRHWIEGQTVVAHNVSFDRSCLDQALEFYGLEPVAYETQCTYRIWGHSLDSCCRDLGIPLKNHHDALEDAMACARLYLEAGRQGKVPNQHRPATQNIEAQLQSTPSL